MKQIRLSFCIPTYNYGRFIGETIQSIVSQYTDDTEIVIVDGASTDNTEEVVRSFQKRFPNINYYCGEKNMGVDRDLAKAVELARGEYCWLMSSDDVLKPDSIRAVIEETRNKHSVYLCNRTDCDRNLHTIKDKSWMPSQCNDQLFTFLQEEEAIEYFNAAISIGALFSYISCIIVERERWNSTSCEEIILESNYAHVFRLFSILQNGGDLKYINKAHILCRGDNDSFKKNGIANRFIIDLNGYDLLANKLYPKSASVRSAFKSVLRREHVWYMLPGLRSRIDDPKVWRELEKKFMDYGYSRINLSIVNSIGSSKYLMKLIRFGRRINGWIKGRYW